MNASVEQIFQCLGQTAFEAWMGQQQAQALSAELAQAQQQIAQLETIVEALKDAPEE